MSPLENGGGGGKCRGGNCRVILMVMIFSSHLIISNVMQ